MHFSPVPQVALKTIRTAPTPAINTSSLTALGWTDQMWWVPLEPQSPSTALCDLSSGSSLAGPSPCGLRVQSAMNSLRGALVSSEHRCSRHRDPRQGRCLERMRAAKPEGRLATPGLGSFEKLQQVSGTLCSRKPQEARGSYPRLTSRLHRGHEDWRRVVSCPTAEGALPCTPRGPKKGSGLTGSRHLGTALSNY